MNLIVLFAILVIHWIADFILQSDEQAKKKSSDTGFLLAHTATYSGVWFIAVTFYAIIFGFSGMAVIYFTTITFVAHTITDYYTSRLNSYLWKKGDAHNFFVSVGADQILHYVQLILTFVLLFG